MKPVSIVYVTCRANPKIEWFLHSLLKQASREDLENIELIVIDGHLWHPDVCERAGDLTEIGFADGGYHDKERRRHFEIFLDQRFPHVLHTPPKPCAYQGPWRQTTRDFFCAGNTRNTAFIVAKHPYLVFVDDLSTLGGTWLDQVKHAAEGEYVALGMYEKVLNLHPMGAEVKFESYDGGRDSRWGASSPNGAIPYHGSALYGCSFGVPLEAALEVDGFDAAMNGQGGEDTDFGHRLERASWAVFLNQNLFTLEDEGLHHDGSKLPQERKLVPPHLLPKAYEHYRYAREDEKYWSDHVVLNRLNNEPERILPLIGDNLRALRKRYMETGLVPVPAPGQIDWRTGLPLSEL